MALDVIGAGFGRTATLSLKQALEQLGFGPCYHMSVVFDRPGDMDIWAAAHRGETVDWPALFEGFRAAVDWPSCNFWQQQLEAFPEARVILSHREPGRWYDSVMKTIYPSSQAARDSDDPGRRSFGEWVNELVWEGVFDGRMEDREFAISVYRKHVSDVITRVPPTRLLVFEAEHGWGPLCSFLDVPVPDEDFPHTNTAEEFLGRDAAAARH